MSGQTLKASSLRRSSAGQMPADPGNVHRLQPSASQVQSIDPATTIVRMPDLLALTGLQRATVYKRIKDDPTFPRPVPLSDSTARGAPVGFVLAEVQAWVRARIAARGEAAA